MKISLMQPYFFPYIGYFSLIKSVDQFIIFDTAQYIRRGWINRNRILSVGDSVTYINVPVQKAPIDTSIKDMKIAKDPAWRDRMLGQLAVYKKKAPYYEEVSDFINERCLKTNTDSLSELNVQILEEICDYLNIGHNIQLLSQMNLSLPEIQAPDDWGLYVTKALNGKVYINPPGGIDFYNREKYKAHGIEIQFIKNNLPFYDQKRENFEAGLSIIDVMMFNDKEMIRRMVDDYQVI